MRRRTGAYLQPASGALSSPSAKADLRIPGRARIETKETSKSKYTLRAADLDKLCRQSKWDELPVFSIYFIDRMMIRLVPDDDDDDDDDENIPFIIKNNQITLDITDVADMIGGTIELEGAQEHRRWRVDLVEAHDDLD